jgi:hypothetical protein
MTDTVRPEDAAAEPAASAPAAPTGDDLDSYLTEFETATSRPASQPEQPTDHKDGASLQTSSPATSAAPQDPIDQLLDELSKPSGYGPPRFGDQHEAAQWQQAEQQQVEQQRAAEQFSALQSENQQLRAHIQRATDQAALDKLTSELQARLPQHLPPDFARTQLIAMAAQTPNLVAAFDLRGADRRAADAELRKVEAEFAR